MLTYYIIHNQKNSFNFVRQDNRNFSRIYWQNHDDLNKITLTISRRWNFIGIMNRKLVIVPDTACQNGDMYIIRPQVNWCEFKAISFRHNSSTVLWKVLPVRLLNDQQYFRCSTRCHLAETVPARSHPMPSCTTAPKILPPRLSGFRSSAGLLWHQELEKSRRTCLNVLLRLEWY